MGKSAEPVCMGMKLVQSQQGFSLIEMMVVLSISTVIALGMSDYVYRSMKNELLIGKRLEVRSLATELNEVSKNANCSVPDLQTGIAITNWNASTEYQLPNGFQSGYLNLAANGRYGQVNVTAVKITGYNDRSTTPPRLAYVALNEAGTRVKASLAVDVRYRTGDARPAGPAGPAGVSEEVNSTLYVPVVLQTDGTVIRGCTNEDLDLVANNNCLALGGVWTEETGLCKLPCPTGMEESPDGICKIPVSEEKGFVCDVNDTCGANPKYIVPTL